jgi:hypothetical protein
VTDLPQSIHDRAVDSLRRCRVALDRYAQVLEAGRAAVATGDAQLLESLLDAGDEAIVDARAAERLAGPALALVLSGEVEGPRAEAVSELRRAGLATLARIRTAAGDLTDAGTAELEVLARELLALSDHPHGTARYPRSPATPNPALIDTLG